MTQEPTAKKPKGRSLDNLKPDEILKAEQELLAEEIALKKRKKDLEKIKRKTAKDWVNVHVTNVTFKMLYEGKIDAKIYDEYLENNLNEDFQKEAVRAAITKYINSRKESEKEEEKPEIKEPEPIKIIDKTSF